MTPSSALLSPIAVGRTTLKNRIIKAPQTLMYWGPGQEVSDRVVDAYEGIAAGGAGMIVLGGCLFMEPGDPDHPFGGFYDDRFVPGLRRLTAAVRDHDCKLIAQLYHGGPVEGLYAGGRAIASSTFSEEELPSPVPWVFPTRGLTLEEIGAVKERFFAAAERAQRAGFDGIEVHAAHGYLILSFVSRVWNTRTDRYGSQSMENRTRLAVELIEGVRERCGDDFIVGVRINGEEFAHPRAITLEEGAESAAHMQAAGADYVSVTGYGYGPVPIQYMTDYWTYPEPDPELKELAPRMKDGLLVPAAATVKAAIDIPTFAVGRMDEKIGERILRDGKADGVILGRALWADPELPRKLMEGREEDIVRCTRCATCEQPPGEHTEHPMDVAPKRCQVNPALGRERELAIRPAIRPKRVVVVGGGPAGMEAARVAALRGHSVTLLERSAQLGGKLHLATLVKGRRPNDLLSIAIYLRTQLRKLGVDVRLKTVATPESIERLRPESLVIAAGGDYGAPSIPGIGERIVTTVPALAKKAELPMRILGPDSVHKLSQRFLPGVGGNVVILGGQIEGLQGAIFLRKRGRRVTVLEESDQTGVGVPPRYLAPMRPWLARNDIEILTEVKFERITREGIRFAVGGVDQRRAADTIMVLMPPRPNLDLAESLRGAIVDVRAIGSANGAAAKLTVDALRQGREVGVAL